MINVDLSKGLYLRPLLYLLALFPGLFFLLSFALADPWTAKQIVGELSGVFSLPLYALSLILTGAGLVVGEAFILVAWALEMAISAILKAVTGKPGDGQTPEAKAVWFCVVAATEALLKKSYGINEKLASGPNGGEWQVWASVLGKPITPMVESLNAGRTILATGIAGFVAMMIAPGLAQRYYFSMCSLFVFAGVWTAIGYFRVSRSVVKMHAIRLKSILLELKEASQATHTDSK